MVKGARIHLAARVVVVTPPAGVAFAVQKGRNELGARAISTGADLQLDFTLQVERGSDGSPRFLGEFVQGPPGGKFVYVNSGTMAGQPESRWTRRAKVGLKGLNWSAVERAAAEPEGLLVGSISGVARDGGPACASVPLLGHGWVIKPALVATSGRTRARG